MRTSQKSKGVECRASSVAGARAHAFTLLEVILALGIFAVVLVAINTAFFAALRLRQRTTENLEQTLPLNQALSTLRRDLQNTVLPGGVLAGDFNSDGPSGTRSSGQSGSQSGGQSKGMARTQMGGLDFFTSTGQLSDNAPWGDIQEVNYQLKEPEDRAQFYGRDLVRTVTRNLLATATQVTDEQRLVNNVESLDFSYFDGTQWRDSWNTSSGDTGLPSAVRLRLQLATESGPTPRGIEPLEMVVLLDSTSSTNTTQTASSTGGGG
jgi:type II secretion system protein J